MKIKFKNTLHFLVWLVIAGVFTLALVNYADTLKTNRELEISNSSLVEDKIQLIMENSYLLEENRVLENTLVYSIELNEQFTEWAVDKLFDEEVNNEQRQE